MQTELGRLLDEAEQQAFSGWDFSWLTGRVRTAPLPWAILGFSIAPSARAWRSFTLRSR